MITIHPENVSNVDVLGLGVFDGLHRGHKTLLEHCTHLLSLFPHPAKVLGKADDLKMITMPNEMRYLFPGTITLQFNKKIAQLSPQEFLDTIILERIKPKKIVIGYDYHFGAGREGNFDFLRSWAATHGIDVQEISPYDFDGIRVKSSIIRDLLREGRIKKANHLMGHPYLIMGPVISGEGRGHHLGFPTANIATSSEKLLPKSGVYGGRVEIDGSSFKAICYVGCKPTFDGTQVGVEVHVPGHDLSLYDKTIRLFVMDTIRPEMQFDSEQALRHQISSDLKTLDTLVP